MKEFTITTEFDYCEFTCKADRFLFIDYEKDAKTIMQFLTSCVPSGTYDELVKIITKKTERETENNTRQIIELLTAAKLALIHLDQCHDYDAESAQIGAQAITALREAIRHAKG